MSYPYIVAPSLLAGNHAQFSESEKIIAGCHLEWIHLDIMDGHFVPNISFGPQTLADLRPQSKLYFDTHLMLDNPHKYIEPFVKAGSQNITIHVEPDYPVLETLKHIKQLGCHCGISLNPGTPADALLPFLKEVDLVLVMTVQPGFGGQSFKSEMLDKIEQIDQWRKEKGFNYRLQVDGGINAKTGLQCRERGADTFVAGTAFFKAKDREAFCKQLTH